MVNNEGSGSVESYEFLLREIFPDLDEPGVRQPEVKSAELSELARTLYRDLRALHALAIYPVLCVGHAKAIAQVETQARLSIGRASDDSREDPEFLEAARRLSAEYSTSGPNRMRDSVRTWERILEPPHLDDGLTRGRDAIYAALTLWAYTIFEAFSTDLWIKAVSACPSSLGASALENCTAKLPLKSLGAYCFDGNGLGKLLKAHGQATFTSAEAIEITYKATFRNQHDATKDCEALKDVFAPHRDTIRRLECVRNLIAHRAGRIDSQFADDLRTRKMVPAPEDKAIGQPYRLRPQEIGAFILAARELPKSLLAFVDKWLIDHPEDLANDSSSGSTR